MEKLGLRFLAQFRKNIFCRNVSTTFHVAMLRWYFPPQYHVRQKRKNNFKKGSKFVVQTSLNLYFVLFIFRIVSIISAIYVNQFEKMLTLLNKYCCSRDYGNLNSNNFKDNENGNSLSTWVTMKAARSLYLDWYCLNYSNR